MPKLNPSFNIMLDQLRNMLVNSNPPPVKDAEAAQSEHWLRIQKCREP